MSEIERFEVNEEWAHSGHGEDYKGKIPRKVSRTKVHTDRICSCGWQRWFAIPGRRHCVSWVGCQRRK